MTTRHTNLLFGDFIIYFFSFLQHRKYIIIITHNSSSRELCLVSHPSLCSSVWSAEHLRLSLVASPRFNSFQLFQFSFQMALKYSHRFREFVSPVAIFFCTKQTIQISSIYIRWSHLTVRCCSSHIGCETRWGGKMIEFRECFLRSYTINLCLINLYMCRL